MTENEPSEKMVIVDEKDVAYARDLAAEHGLRVREVGFRGIEPVSTATLILLGSAAAVSTVTYRIDQHKGGQVIDLRPQAPRMIYRTKDLIYGFVLIIAIDGSVSIEVREPRETFNQVLDALKSIMTEISDSGINDIAAAVNKSVGDAAVVRKQLR